MIVAVQACLPDTKLSELSLLCTQLPRVQRSLAIERLIVRMHTQHKPVVAIDTALQLPVPQRLQSPSSR